VHRDIKPENIILAPDGKVFFLDFGIARILGVPSLTKTEAMIGPHSPGYAAPEQFNNLKSDIDSRADLFSIGVVTYECLSGKNPFSEGARNHLEVLQRTETITPISFRIQGDSQHQFMGLLSSLMGKYPSRRPNNATQALHWLNAAKSTFLNEEASVKDN
jgi:serine/threonine-protein kinase